MRHIERIDVFLAELGKKWKEQGADLRFTQFLFNNGITDTCSQYYLEEPEVLEMFGVNPYSRDFVFWGTYGKDGKGPVKRILIKDLETDHIEAILKTQKQLNDKMRKLFEDELVLRKKV